MENYVKFKRGTAAAFAALGTKDPDTLYFITNEDNSVSLYLGENKSGVSEDELKELLSINDLTDVNIADTTDIKNGYVLAYEDGIWKPAYNASTDTSGDGLSGQLSALSGEVNDLKTLTGTHTTQIGDLQTDLETLTTNVDNTYAKKIDIYTKTETDDAIADAMVKAGHLKREVVSTLPEVEDAAEDVIYLVLDTDAEDGNKYDEYMLVNGALERLGDWEVDLSGYATTGTVSDLTTRVDGVEGRVDTAEQQISTMNGEIDTLQKAGYVNGDEVDTKITTALTGYVSDTQLTETLKNYALSSDLNNYVTTTTYNGKVENIEGRLDTIEGALTWVELTV